MGRFVASNLNLGQDTRAFWVFVAYPIESCAVWEGEPAQYTGMPLRRALMERYSALGSGLGHGAWALAVSERQRQRSQGNIGWRTWYGGGHSSRDGGGMEIAGQRPSKRATATVAMAAMVVREGYRMLDGDGGDGDGDGGDDDGSNGVDGDGG